RCAATVAWVCALMLLLFVTIPGAIHPSRSREMPVDADSAGTVLRPATFDARRGAERVLDAIPPSQSAQLDRTEDLQHGSTGTGEPALPCDDCESDDEREADDTDDDLEDGALLSLPSRVLCPSFIWPRPHGHYSEAHAVERSVAPEPPPPRC
ncbi:MAG: hypothetical protein RL385_2729, partial [Pseudomonadota bacterium]